KISLDPTDERIPEGKRREVNQRDPHPIGRRCDLELRAQLLQPMPIWGATRISSVGTLACRLSQYTEPMPTLDVDGAALAWEESGVSSPTTPSVVLLHGLGARAADWSFQVPALAERYRVIAVDLPGHGRSALPVERITIDGIASRVCALVSHVSAGPVHLVGLSLGGCVALALAAQTPACVRSLTLVNAFARLRPTGPRGVLQGLVRLALLAVAPMPIVAAHVARGLFPKREQPDLYLRAVASLGATSRAGYVAGL